jgi:chloramphenicol-sensitive protein RarD
LSQRKKKKYIKIQEAEHSSASFNNAHERNDTASFHHAAERKDPRSRSFSGIRNFFRLRSRQGAAFAILCAVLWGILPIYWKSLEAIDPILILFYRILLAFFYALFLGLCIYKRQGLLEPLKRKGIIGTFFFAGLLISLNWGIYIWAVNSGYLIQTSIGYYIEPLIVGIFGVAFFKERLNAYKMAAFLFACAGVAVILVYYRQIPGIALTLAISFATYAAIKKRYQLDAVLALLYETMFLVPFAFGMILYYEITGKGAFTTAEPYQWGLLALAGVLTGTPLLLFAMAANRVSLITLGVTEYISPSLTLLLGIFLYHEKFEGAQMVTFALIWIGLAVFTAGEIKESRKAIKE